MTSTKPNGIVFCVNKLETKFSSSEKYFVLGIMSQSILRLIISDQELQINLSFELTDKLSYYDIFNQLRLKYPQAIAQETDIRFTYNINFCNKPTEICIKNHVGFEIFKKLCQSKDVVVTRQQDCIQLTPHLRQKFDQLSKTKDGLVIICI